MNDRPSIVHIIGTGTIGEPLIGLLTTYRSELGVDEVTFHKRSPHLRDRAKLLGMVRRGARLCCPEGAMDSFRDAGLNPVFTHDEALERATVVIDCTPASAERTREYYERYALQASGIITYTVQPEFGPLYARGINDQAILTSEPPKFL